YVGNLDPTVTEDLLMALFGSIGPCKGCKIIHETGNEPYAFVEFSEHSSAALALGTMNKRTCFGREMKVNWATSPGTQTKQDTSKHHHIFVGDLSPDIETPQLREAFKPFGTISDCKIIRDPQTLKSKGYGFVSYVERKEAENAINSMNGQWIGSRAIRTNWAIRKPAAPATKETNAQPLTFDEVFKKSSPTNCTVYCGGILSGLTEDLVRSAFGEHGKIEEIRVFKDKGYAFIRYNTKEAATEAIVKMHQTEVGGHTVKCSWGKESKDSPADPNGQGQMVGSQVSQPSPASQGGYMPQGYGYGYGTSGYSGMPVQWQGMQMTPGQQQQYSAAAGQQQQQQQTGGVQYTMPQGP
ncbi:hypothetical protein CAPTEDRAFT_110688, partial [Capitella teleta]